MRDDVLLHVFTFMATTDKKYADIDKLEWALYRSCRIGTMYFRSVMNQMKDEGWLYYDEAKGYWTTDP